MMEKAEICFITLQVVLKYVDFPFIFIQKLIVINYTFAKKWINLLNNCELSYSSSYFEIIYSAFCVSEQ